MLKHATSLWRAAAPRRALHDQAGAGPRKASWQSVKACPASSTCACLLTCQGIGLLGNVQNEGAARITVAGLLGRDVGVDAGDAASAGGGNFG